MCIRDRSMSDYILPKQVWKYKPIGDLCLDRPRKKSWRLFEGEIGSTLLMACCEDGDDDEFYIK